jgi:protein phosphatase
MGTTVTSAMIEGDRLLIAQVGDSRAYMLCGGALRQVTKDHSLMEEMIEASQISEEEARVHPNRSIITRALGSAPDTFADIYDLTVNEGDVLLLCTDGLSNMLCNDEMESILRENGDPQAAADRLVGAANAAGGQDNITAIVVRVDDVSPPHTHRKDRRRSWLSLIAFILAFPILVAAAFGGLFLYASNSAYLKLENMTQLTLYKGLPDAAMGMRFSWEQNSVRIDPSRLDPNVVEKLKGGVQFSSLDEGKDSMAEIAAQAAGAAQVARAAQSAQVAQVARAAQAAGAAQVAQVAQAAQAAGAAQVAQVAGTAQPARPASRITGVPE